MKSYFPFSFVPVNVVLTLCFRFALVRSSTDSQGEPQNSERFAVAVAERVGGRDRVTRSVTERHSLRGQYGAIAKVSASTNSPQIRTFSLSGCLFDLLYCAFFSSRVQQSAVTGVATVCKTPEKKLKPNPSTGPHRAPRLTAPRMDDRLVVDDTMRLSCGAVQNTDSQRKEPEPKPSGAATSLISSSASAFLSNSKDFDFE